MMVSHFLTALAISAMLSLMAKAARKGPQVDEQGDAVLRHGWPTWFGGISGLVVGAFFVASLFILPDGTIAAYVTIGAIAAAFLALGAYCLHACLAERVAVDADGFTTYCFERVVREVRWSDIQRVTCNGRLGQLTVIDSEDRKIRISTAMRGITFLADKIAEHVPADRWSDEFSAVRGVSKPDACASPYLRSLVPQQADQRQLSDDETSRALAGVQRRIGSMVALVYGSLGVAIYLNVHDLVIPFNATTSLIRWVVVLSVPLAFTFSWVNATILARRGRDDLIADSFGSLSEEADVVALFDVYRSQTLASAMIQTLMALCCVVAYYLVGSASALAMTIILGIAIRSHSPNADRAARWIKRQLEIVRKQRAAFTGRLALQPR